MSKYDWKSEEEKESRPKRLKKKIDKNRYCRKNRLKGKGVNYGPHIYEENSRSCIKCGHVRKENKNEFK